MGGAQGLALYTADNLGDGFESCVVSGTAGILDDKAKELKNISFYQVKELQRFIRPIKDFVALVKLTSLLRELKPDVVHTHSSKAGILGRWAAYFAKVPVIVHTYHGFGFNDFQRALVKKLYVFLEKITASVTTKFITVSSLNIDKALKEGISRRDKYITIHCGIDIDKFKDTSVDKEAKLKELNIPLDSKIVGTVACFKPQKAPLDFVDAAYLLLKEESNTIFIMIGDGILRDDIERKIKDLGIDDKFFLLGWREDIAQILKIMDVFVLTSLWEGLPVVLLESMAAGVPVVATGVDGTKEVIGDGYNGFLVEPHDTVHASEKIGLLLNNEETRDKYIKNSIDRLNEDFSIDNMVNKIKDLYKQESSL